MLTRGAKGEYHKTWLTRLGFLLIGGFIILPNGVAILAVPLDILAILYFLLGPLFHEPFNAEGFALSVAFFFILLFWTILGLIGWRIILHAIRPAQEWHN